ncbi:Pre-mRNA-splicing factor CWC2 [Serendipita indica DSM 11827]|uniref:Related to CWC2-involved in mRNA splicing n=1 Tax=Serendipita indica (strain DSM 11827) TaxID=1109443 RepID=G4TI12_SERID|nr:Pre-mRNA-splicing factor CWC2 [Serendipita indica DSM 11827]CCA70946.1 related to CWC2-involved in mRNA splicing [Serendipita indica DSM 11827]
MSDHEDTGAPASNAMVQAKKDRPARKQVKPGQVTKNEVVQSGKEYNIWYNKWAGGDREDAYSNKVKSQTRCNIRTDTGWTRAEKTGMKYCCLYFARGCCPYGYECNYRHRLPDPTQTLPDTAKDCFARDKFADYRDDMGGVGSFQRENRTLYIGRIKETGPGPDTEEVVRRHFSEWGEIDRLRVLQYRGIAFVTYVHEVNAQFAREAMACQSMDNDEILNVRWATEDPNPTTKVIEKRRLEEIGSAVIATKLDPRMVDAMRAVRALEDGDDLEENEELPESVEEPPSKKRKMEEVEQPANMEIHQPPPQNGIISAEALQGIKALAEMRNKRLGGPPAVPKPGLKGLAAYGSDDEDDD